MRFRSAIPAVIMGTLSRILKCHPFAILLRLISMSKKKSIKLKVSNRCEMIVLIMKQRQLSMIFEF